MNLLNIHDWSALAAALGAIFTFAGVIIRLYLRNGYATKTDLADTRKSLVTLGKRTEALEAQLPGVATRDDISRVMVAIERADGDRRALAAEVSGVKTLITRIEHTLDLIQESLLRGNKD